MSKLFEAGLQQIEIHLRLETALHMAECMQKTVAFSKVWLSGGDIPAEMDKETKNF